MWIIFGYSLWEAFWNKITKVLLLWNLGQLTFKLAFQCIFCNRERLKQHKQHACPTGTGCSTTCINCVNFTELLSNGPYIVLLPNRETNQCKATVCTYAAMVTVRNITGSHFVQWRDLVYILNNTRSWRKASVN